MDVLFASSPLVDQLARSIDVVCRIRLEPHTRRGQAKQKHLDEWARQELQSQVARWRP